MPQTPQNLDAMVAGRRLEIVRYRGARGDRRAIVLLHEGLGSVSAWRDFPQVLALRTQRDVYAYSRYGYGRSERLESPRETSYLHDEALRVLPALLETLALERPILIGHSDGASIAIIFAGAYPDAVAGVVAAAPHVFVEDAGLAGIRRAKIAYDTTDLANRLARHHDDAPGAFAGWHDTWLDPRFRDWNIERYLDTLAAPMLVLQGADDEYGGIAQVDAIAARADVRAVIVENCGHSPHRDAPERTLDEIERFVSEID